MAIDESQGYDRLDRLAEEFADRFRRGERPSLKEYTDRYPELADDIRELFPALVKVEQVEEICQDRGEAERARTAVPPLSQVGDYRIVREVGHGGMGVVYEAEQVSLGRRVALKVLPWQGAKSRTALERFRREARASARLHHTNIVPVFEVGQDGEVQYYAMQYIQGQSLDAVIDELRRLRGRTLRERGRRASPGGHDDARPSDSGTRGPDGEPVVARSLLTGRFDRAPTLATAAGSSLAGPDGSVPSQPDPLQATDTSAVMPGGEQLSSVESRHRAFHRGVAHIGRQVAAALAHAHARGILHRDIKPSNLLLDTEGVVWVSDFGLAKVDDDELTRTGDVLGTLRYMAPERFRGRGDARADVYSLGLTLYELLTLRPAFDSPDRLALSEQIKHAEPPRPRSTDPRIPRDLETIVLKAIEKEPGDRYATAEAMAEDLRRFLDDEPIRARQTTAFERYWRWARRNRVIAALGAVLTGVLILATAGSLVAASRFARMARRERLAREEASRQATAESIARAEALQARDAAEEARAVAQEETYRATLSEVKALRAGRQLGWREEALANLARLVGRPDPHRDLLELRTQAVACIGEFGVSEVARFKLSGSAAYSLDFSPDSRTLVTASDEGDLELWDVTTRRILARFQGAARSDDLAMGNGGLVRYLPDGDLAFLSATNQVGFLGTLGRPSARPPIGRDPTRARKLEVAPRRRTLAVGWGDGRIDLYDVGTGALQRSFDSEDLWDYTFSPDGRWLALQKYDGPIQLVPTDGQGTAFTLGARSGFFPALAFSPDGSAIAGVEGRSVSIWDLSTKRELLKLSGHKESITAIAFSADGELVATACGDSMTRIWDARDGRTLAALPGPWYMRRLAFSPDGEYLAASAHPGPVCLYRLKGRREQRRLVGHHFGSLAVAFHPRLPRLASSSDDRSIIIWDVREARPLRRWIAHSRQVTALAYSPDGSLLASARGASNANDPSDEDHAIHLWDADKGTLRKRLDRASHSGVWRLAFGPMGRRVASGDEGGTVLLWDVAGGRSALHEEAVSSGLAGVVFHDGGRELIVGSEDGEVTLLDMEHSDPNRSIHLADGCKRLVVDGHRNRVVIGDRAGGLVALSLPDLTAVVRLANGHDGAIAALALSPDGRLLATSGMDQHVVLRDSATFESLLTFPAWTGVVRDLSFDASGRWLALAGADSDVSLWDLHLVHDELASMGLAWDQIAPAPQSAANQPASGERSSP